MIERNLDPPTLGAFKRDLNDRLAETGEAIEQGLRLPCERGLQLLMRTYALTRGLWLSFGDGHASHGGPANRPKVEFRSELAEALAEYWRGALAGLAE